MRVVTPVRTFEQHSVPLDGRPAKEFIKARRRHFRHDVRASAEFVELFHELMHVGMPLQKDSNRTS